MKNKKTRFWVFNEYRLLDPNPFWEPQYSRESLESIIINKIVIQEVPIEKTEKDIINFLQKYGIIGNNTSFSLQKEENINETEINELKHCYKISWF